MALEEELTKKQLYRLLAWLYISVRERSAGELEARIQREQTGDKHQWNRLDLAAMEYVRIYEKLIEYCSRHFPGWVKADRLADETVVRVAAEKLFSWRLSEAEMRNIPALCSSLIEEGEKALPSPGRRIFELLPQAAREVVASIAQTKSFTKKQRLHLVRALNNILKRRDFYQANDFEKVDVGNEVKAFLERGETNLSDKKVERLNRLLLEASYPQLIEKNHVDKKDKDRLTYFKRVARIIYLEYINKRKEVPLTDEESSTVKEPQDKQPADTPVNVDIPVTVHIPNPQEEREEEEEKIRRRDELECMRECEQRLTPEERELIVAYVKDENKGQRKKDWRKKLAQKLSISPVTLRVRVHRIRKKLQKCRANCLKKKAM